MSLERFHDAQAGRRAGYASALAEIRASRKSGHWIWYIFPQLDGLGNSTTARIYAIRDLDEACGYLLDPVLRARYEEITAAVAEQLARGVSIGNLMGGSTDALKLVSSLTLFRLAASRIVKGECESVFALLEQLCESVLQQTAAQGYGPCQFTIDRSVLSPPPACGSPANP